MSWKRPTGGPKLCAGRPLRTVASLVGFEIPGFPQLKKGWGLNKRAQHPQPELNFTSETDR